MASNLLPTAAIKADVLCSSVPRPPRRGFSFTHTHTAGMSAPSENSSHVRLVGALAGVGSGNLILQNVIISTSCDANSGV